MSNAKLSMLLTGHLSPPLSTLHGNVLARITVLIRKALDEEPMALLMPGCRTYLGTKAHG